MVLERIRYGDTVLVVYFRKVRKNKQEFVVRQQIIYLSSKLQYT
jgi:hypothetical protein